MFVIEGSPALFTRVQMTNPLTNSKTLMAMAFTPGNGSGTLVIDYVRCSSASVLNDELGNLRSTGGAISTYKAGSNAKVTHDVLFIILRKG